MTRAWGRRRSAPWSSASPCSSPTGTDDALLRLPERVAVTRGSTGSSSTPNSLQAASRPQSSWGRAKGRRRSAPGSRPSALPCPGSQVPVRSTARRHLDILTPIHAEASSACSVMRTGVGKATLGAGVERVAVHIAGGHGRRTAPVALARCRAPRLNRFVLNTKFVVRGTPQAHDAASPARRSK